MITTAAAPVQLELPLQWAEPVLGESARYRTARKGWDCANQDRMPRRPSGCAGMINCGDRYIERHGVRYCLPCGTLTWQVDG